MNWVKNIVGKRGSDLPEGAAAISLDSDWAGAEEAARIRKLFAEHSAVRNEEAKDAKLSEIMPMFCRVYQNVNPSSIGSAFPEVHNFAYQTARRFVIRVRTLAGNQSRELAAKAIVDFLSKKSGGIGWHMLCSLDILSAVDEQSLEAMVRASLPSTLVKCMYLFMDLVEDQGSAGDEVEATREREESLNDRYKPHFSNLLIKVAQNTAAADELLKTDDICLFFRIATMPTSEGNRIWRKVSVEALSLFCRHCLSARVCTYIHKEGCVSSMVNNLKKSKEIELNDAVDICTTVLFVVLKESGKTTRRLMEEFSDCDGYQLVVDIILKLFARKEDEESKHIAAQLMTLSFELLFYGPTDLTPTIREVSKYLDEGFHLPRPSGAGVSVRNPDACLLFLRLFQRTRSVTVREQCVDFILNIISLDTVNYYLLDHFGFLNIFLEHIEKMRGDGKIRVFQLLEYVACSLNFVPVEALATLVNQLQSKPSLSTSSLSLKTIIKLLNMSSKFSNLFRENGLLDILIPVTKYYTDKLVRGGMKEASDPEKEYFELLSECLVLMLDNNLANMDAFQEQGGFPILYQLILMKNSRTTALRIFQHYILNDKTYSKNHMSALLDTFVRASDEYLEMKCDIVFAMSRMASRSDFAKEIFCAAEGYELIFKALETFAGVFEFKYDPNLDASSNLGNDRESRSEEAGKQTLYLGRAKLLVSILCLLCETISNCRSNETYFIQKCNGYYQLEVLYVNSGILLPKTRGLAFDLLFAMGNGTCTSLKPPFCTLDTKTGIVSLEVTRSSSSGRRGFGHRKLPSSVVGVKESEDFKDQVIRHGKALCVLFEVLPLVEEYFQIQIIQKVKLLTESERNQQVLSKSLVPETLLVKFDDVLKSSGHPVYNELSSLLVLIARHYIPTSSLRLLLESKRAMDKPLPLDFERLKLLNTLSALNESPCFNEFNMSSQGFGCVYSTLKEGCYWPPSNGYSFMMWFCIEKYSSYSEGGGGKLLNAKNEHPVRLLTCVDNDIVLRVQISGRKLHLIAAGQTVCFDDFTFLCGEWYHIAVVHVKQRLRGSIATLYVNGDCIQTVKLSYLSGSSALVAYYFGSGYHEMQVSSLHWKFASCLMLAECLSHINISCMNLLGPTYTGNFQGALKHFQTFEMVANSMFKKNGKDINVLKAMACLKSALINEESIVISYNARGVMQGKLSGLCSQSYSKHPWTFIALGSKFVIDSNSLLLMKSAADVKYSGEKWSAVFGGSSRSFSPVGFANSLRQVGGVSVILKMIMGADTPEYLIVCLKILLNSIKSNWRNTLEMDRVNGYQLLALVLKKKRHLLTLSVLPYLTRIVLMNTMGEVDEEKDAHLDRDNLSYTGAIMNMAALKYFFLDYDIWRGVDEGVQLAVYRQVYTLAADSAGFRAFNYRKLRKLHIVQKLLFVLRDESVPFDVMQYMVNIILTVLLKEVTRDDLERLKAFLVLTISPDQSIGDTQVMNPKMKKNLSNASVGSQSRSVGESGATVIVPSYITERKVKLRNMIFEVILSVAKANKSVIPKYIKYMGVDFFMLFITKKTSTVTVSLATRLLVMNLLYSSHCLSSFKKIHNGFMYLCDVLPEHCGNGQIYFLLWGLAFGYDVNAIPFNIDYNLTNLHAVFRLPKQCNSIYSFEAFHVLFSLFRRMFQNFLLKNNVMGCVEDGSVGCTLLKAVSEPSVSSNPYFGSPSAVSGRLTEATLNSSAENISYLPNEFCKKTEKNDAQNPYSEHHLSVESIDKTALEGGYVDSEVFLQWSQSFCATTIKYIVYLYEISPPFKDYCSKEEFINGVVTILFPEDVFYSGTDPSSRAAEFTESSKSIRQMSRKVFMKSQESLNSKGSGSEAFDEVAREASEMEVNVSCEHIDVDDHLENVKDDKEETSHMESIVAELYSLIYLMGPVAENVMTFLKKLVWESFIHSSKALGVLKVILASVPCNIVEVDTLFQTQFLLDLMNFYIECENLEDLMVSHPKLVLNTHQFANFVVDKVHQNFFPPGKLAIIHIFVVNLVEQMLVEMEVLKESLNAMKTAKTGKKSRLMHTDESNPADELYRAFNRIILYHTSHLSDKAMSGPAVLNKLIDCRSLLFAESNDDRGFFTCLCENLFSLTVSNDNEDLRESLAILWRHLLVQKEGDMRRILLFTNDKTGEVVDLYEGGFDKLVEASMDDFLCWVKKNQHLLGVVFDRNISSVWNDYEQFELKHCSESLQDAFSEKNNIKRKRTQNATFEALQKVEIDMMNKVLGEQHEGRRNYVKYRQTVADVDKFLVKAWGHLSTDLERVRGVFGRDGLNHLDMWRLCLTEGPLRMRKKLLKDDEFYVKYPFNPTNKGEKLLSFASEEHYRKYYYQESDILHSIGSEFDSSFDFKMEKQVSDIKLLHTDTDEDKQDEAKKDQELHQTGSDEASQSQSVDELDNRSDILSASSTIDEDKDQFEREDGTWTEVEDDLDMDENQQITRLLEPGDKIEFMFNCARVEQLDGFDGLLILGTSHIYIVDGFCISTDEEVVHVDQAVAAGTHERIAPEIPISVTDSSSSGTNVTSKRSDPKIVKWEFNDIQEVHKRRYLLQNVGIEIFSADGRNYLFALKKADRDRVLSKLMARATRAVMPLDPDESSGGIFSSLWGASSSNSITQSWVKGEISNFQYLMYLNTLAGRTYNDLTQYPVFPWVIADYESEELDLENPKTFRDLSKPMGAQLEERKDEFVARYEAWDDPDGSPAFHYGTHYSSAMIVASYLVRLEPFTDAFLSLQGGGFDHPDRMFYSIEEAWLSASKNNMADVKELIPEFYYLPDFLVNNCRFNFGATQNKTTIDGVELPPWAKSDPIEFIRIQRMALESDYVSANLHKWIDLIFGCKQQGPEAVEAVNVFHHLTYEGAVDINAIKDPVDKNSTIAIINNFGQTPKQLFKKPHHARKHVEGVDLCSEIPALSCSPVINRETPDPITSIIITNTHEKVLCSSEQKVLIPPMHSKMLSWGYADCTARVLAADTGKIVSIHEGMHLGQITAAIFADDYTLITGGEDSVVSAWKLPTSSKEVRFMLRGTLYGHKMGVSTLCASRAFSIIVSGSVDGSSIIWDLNSLKYVRDIEGKFDDPVRHISINCSNGDILLTSDFCIVVCDINGRCLSRLNMWDIDVAELMMSGGTSPSTFFICPILCCALVEGCDWYPHSVLVTGHEDGILNFWSMKTKQNDALVDLEAKAISNMILTRQITFVCQHKLPTFQPTNGKDPVAASVTCIKQSRVSRKLFTGDGGGRVFSWTTTQ
eukprot:Nk52_evm131s221 gene=Nk52_evmTU131s221